jgi:hypothetical protein
VPVAAKIVGTFNATDNTVTVNGQKKDFMLAAP